MINYLELLGQSVPFFLKIYELTPERAIKNVLNEYQEYKSLPIEHQKRIRKILVSSLNGLRLNFLSYKSRITPFCQHAINTVLKKPNIIPIRIAIPLVVPNEPSHLHLFILLKAFDLAEIGCTVTLFLEDQRYQEIAKLKNRRWLTPRYAVERFIKCTDRVLKSLRSTYSNVQIGSNLIIECQSRIEDDFGYSIYYDDNNNVLDKIKLGSRFESAIKKMATTRLNKDISASDFYSLVKTYVQTVKYTDCHFLICGCDRRPFYRHLSKNLEGTKGFDAPAILYWGNIPDLKGNIEWKLDDSTLLYPFQDKNNYSKYINANKSFYKWFKANIAYKWPSNTFESNDLDNLIVEKPKEPTLRTLCNEIYKNNKSGIVSIALFGSRLDQIDKSLECMHFDFDKPIPFEGDIDLIIVVNKKTSNIFKIIDKALSPYGKLIHHPDFYTKRESCERLFEVIVLPKNSKFFSKDHLGKLTGLSVFPTKRYITLAGSPIEKVLYVPTSNLKSIKERAKTFLTSQWGLNDMQARLWPLLSSRCNHIDLKRICRFIIVGIIWVKTGEWHLNGDLNEQIQVIKLEQDYENLVFEVLNPEKKINLQNHHNYLIRIYDLVLHLRQGLDIYKN